MKKVYYVYEVVGVFTYKGELSGLKTWKETLYVRARNESDAFTKALDYLEGVDLYDSGNWNVSIYSITASRKPVMLDF